MLETSVFTIIRKIIKYMYEIDDRTKELEEHIKKQDLLIAYVFLQENYNIDDFKKKQANYLLN